MVGINEGNGGWDTAGGYIDAVGRLRVADPGALNVLGEPAGCLALRSFGAGYAPRSERS